MTLNLIVSIILVSLLVFFMMKLIIDFIQKFEEEGNNVGYIDGVVVHRVP